MSMIGLFLLFIALVRILIFPVIPRTVSNLPTGDITVIGTLTNIEEKENSTALYVETQDYGGIIAYVSSSNETGQELIRRVKELKAGNEIRISGTYKFYEKPGNPGQFDSSVYYGIRGIYGMMFVEQLEIKDSAIHFFREGFRKVRNYCSSILNLIFQEEQAGVMKTILLGEKSSMDQELKEQYRRNGIAHILAISGLHISFLGWMIRRILKKCTVGRKASAMISGICMVCYVLMIGAGPSAVRALIFFLISIVGDVIGRGKDGPTAFVLSFGIMVTANPYYLLDAGFHLSYCAVGSICILGRFLMPGMQPEDEGMAVKNSKDKKTIDEKSINMNPEKKTDSDRSFKTTMITAFLLQLGMFPLILNYYYEYPPYSFLLNLLVLPGMGMVLGVGLLGMLAGMLVPIVGKILVLPVSFMLEGYSSLCALSENLPGKMLVLGKPEPWKMVLYYFVLLLAAMLVGYALRNNKKLLTLPRILSGMLCLAVMILLVSVKHQPAFQMTFLDVGQGDSVVVNRNGSVFVVDCGSSDVSKLGRYRFVPFLKSQGIKRIEFFFLTHMDEDHICGLEEILENYKDYGIEIGNIVMTGASLKSEEGKSIMKAANPLGIRILKIQAGDRIQVGEEKNDGKDVLKGEPKEEDSTGEEYENDTLTLLCLYPEDSCDEDSNNSSMVLSVEYGAYRALLVGDLEQEGEEILMNNADLESSYTLLKVGHHGSRGSSSSAFLDRINASYGVISYGKGNRYGHPHKETLDRLASAGVQVFSTEEGGAIIVYFNSPGSYGTVRSRKHS